MESIRRRYIDETYKLIQEHGVSGIRIREVARQVGLNSAMLYRHFDDLDHLIGVTCVRFLIPYYESLTGIIEGNPNLVDANLQSWECFAWYAFNDVPIFLHVFFNGEDHALGERYIREYFELFPEDYHHVPGIFEYLVPIADLGERTRLVLMRAAEQGVIAHDDVEQLAACDVFIMEGMLHAYRHNYREPEKAREATRRYILTIMRNYERALIPGASIMYRFPSRSDMG